MGGVTPSYAYLSSDAVTVNGDRIHHYWWCLPSFVAVVAVSNGIGVTPISIVYGERERDSWEGHSEWWHRAVTVKQHSKSVYNPTGDEKNFIFLLTTPLIRISKIWNSMISGTLVYRRSYVCLVLVGGTLAIPFTFWHLCTILQEISNKNCRARRSLFDTCVESYERSVIKIVEQEKTQSGFKKSEIRWSLVH